MVDITEIYIHWYAGRSKSALAASLGLDRKTIRKYLAPAEASGITPGGPPMTEADWSKLIKEWFPGLADRRLRQMTWPEIDKHRDYIKSLLGTVTVSTIHQRLRDEHKLQVSISSFRRWGHATLPDEAARSQVTVLRDEVEPGSEAQIDYGFLGQWINPRTGRRHRVWAFVMVLPCSRHMFVRPVLHLDQQAWTEAHVAAFRYFGGVPNEAGGVLRKADRLDSQVEVLLRPLDELPGVSGVGPHDRDLGVHQAQAEEDFLRGRSVVQVSGVTMTIRGSPRMSTTGGACGR